jgi:EAL domain-containing protein (putative c-di-GMP-specific phosphodiesterase class I)
VQVFSCTIARASPRVLLEPAPASNAAVGEQRMFFHESCSPAGWQRREWLTRLRRALEHDLFVLHYQPIVSLPDGRVSMYEALVRLADEPGAAPIVPGAFLPAAERYGLIRDIDRMVVEKVVALLGSGAVHPGLRVSVNLSAVSVTDRGLLAFIERRLAHHRADPAQLVLELTETASIHDMQRAGAFCAGVQALGCAVALDDFGAGFGTFSYLKLLPFRYLKIDGEFISGLPDSSHDQLVVKALVGMARGMGRQTIAEFVEDAPTLRLLADFGVDYAQGFQIGRPRAAARSGAGR